MRNKVLERLQTISELNTACEWADKNIDSLGDPATPKRGVIDQKLLELSKSKKSNNIIKKDLITFVMDNSKNGEKLFQRKGKIEWYVESLIQIMKDCY